MGPVDRVSTSEHDLRNDSKGEPMRLILTALAAASLFSDRRLGRTLP
jgi:hypothetical protein